MSSTLNPEDLFTWCRIPTEQLENHPQAKVCIKVLEKPEDVHRYIARQMVDELIQNNRADRPTRWILPCGPIGQYRYFSEMVNQERISLRNLHVFHMDDCLDWQGRPLPLDHPFNYEGWMRRNFYSSVDPELGVPENQRHFPSVYAIDLVSEAIEKAGGIDTTYGGVGYRGHIAYNEPPRSPWYTVTPEEFRNSKTRILNVNDDTLIAVSQRAAGGCSHMVPPMAITLGMKDLLSAKKICIFTETGTWKQTVVRVLLFGPVTTEYPVTFIQEHPNAMLVADRISASPPVK